MPLKGLHLIETLGCSTVIIETGSLEISKACVAEVDVLGPNAAVMMKSFHIIQTLGTVRVQHCQREANKVAHKLARFSVDSSSSLVCDGDPPSFILQDILNDVIVFPMK